jgi:tetratricopeptide (TPR) repeat protein
LAERHLSDHKSIGAGWEQQRRWADAIREYTIAIRLTPEDTTSLVGRGNAFFALGEYDNALADYTEAIRLNAEDGSAFYRRGLAFEKMNKHAKAEADFAKAKQLGYEPE